MHKSSININKLVNKIILENEEMASISDYTSEIGDMIDGLNNMTNDLGVILDKTNNEHINHAMKFVADVIEHLHRSMGE